MHVRQARLQLETLVSDLRRAERRARRDDKPESWHRLRTTSRRLRGALLLCGAVIDPKALADVARAAKRITRLPAQVRDLDVAIAAVKTLKARAASDVEKRAAKYLQKQLERKRRARSAELRSMLKRKKPSKRLEARLDQSMRGRDVASGRHAVITAGTTLRATAQALFEANAAVEDWRDVESLHELRVAVKKHRGALAALEDSEPGANRQRAAALTLLKRVQDTLGEHHDWSELALRLQKRLDASAQTNTAAALAEGYRALLVHAQANQRRCFQRYHRLYQPRLSLLAAVTDQRRQPRRAQASAADVAAGPAKRPRRAAAPPAPPPTVDPSVTVTAGASAAGAIAGPATP